MDFKTSTKAQKLSHVMQEMFKNPEEVKNFWVNFVREKRKPYGLRYHQRDWKTLFEQYLRATGRDQNLEAVDKDSSDEFYAQIKPYIHPFRNERNHFEYPPIPFDQKELKEMFESEESKLVVL